MEYFNETGEKSVVKEAQVESLFKKLAPSTSSTTVNEENIKKCEIQLEECGGDIEEIFIKLYGQPGQLISAEEQREIVEKENARRKRAERISENTEDGKTVEENGSNQTGMVLIDEDAMDQDIVLFEQAEVDWDDLFEDSVAENVEKPTKKSDSFFSCTVV